MESVTAFSHHMPQGWLAPLMRLKIELPIEGSTSQSSQHILTQVQSLTPTAMLNTRRRRITKRNSFLVCHTGRCPEFLIKLCGLVKATQHLTTRVMCFNSMLR